MQIISRALTCALLAGSALALSPAAEAQSFRDKFRGGAMGARDMQAGPMMGGQRGIGGFSERRRPGTSGGGAMLGGGGQGHFPGVQKARPPEGAVEVSIEVDGHARSFYLYKPRGFRHEGSAVLGLHGGGGTAAHLMAKASLPQHAAEHGFLAVFPDGIDGNWNDGRAQFKDRPDDLAFMRGLVDWLVANEGIDRGRVFATGSSNGGAMSHKLACEAPDLVAGITTISANLHDALHAACRPTESTPVLMISGTEDPLMLYNGGTPDIPGRESHGVVLSAPATAEFWAGVAGCAPSPTVRDLPDRVEDGTTVTAITYRCPGDQIILLRVNGGGHGVPGGEPARGFKARLTGPTSQEIDAFALAISFFSKSIP